MCISSSIHTSNELRERFGKHRYDIKKRLPNSKISEHFGEGHNEEGMEVQILQSGICNEQEGKLVDNNSGIDNSIKQYAKDMYTCYKNLHWCSQLQ